MRSRLSLGALVCAWLFALQAVAGGQPPVEETGPNLNWVFILAIIVFLGFLAFVGFAIIYYLLAVVARNRRYVAEAVTAAAPAAQRAAPAAPAAQAAARTAPAPAAAPAASAQQAAPAQAPPPQPAPAAEEAAQPAPAAPAQPAAEAAPAAAGAPAGGVPQIEMMNLPDNIDAVTRGRLKKLAVLQERGQAPPKQLIDDLKGVLEEMSGTTIDVDAAAQAPSQPEAAPPAAPAAQPAPAAEAAPAESPAAPPAAEAAPAPAPEQAAAEEAPAAEPAAEPAAAPEPAPDTGDLPRVDPMNLPDNIDAVTRGRLKKLAIFQERGQAPPADLIESLRPVLDQMKGS